MSPILQTKWKSALINIIEELSELQYKKMLEYLEKIPKSKKTPKNRVQMAQLIIEHHGVEESVRVIRSIMPEIPRNDSAIKDLLQPFVDKLENKTTGMKRKAGADPKSGFEKNNIVSDSESSDEEPEADDAETRSNEEKKVPAWRTSIKHLKISGEEPGKLIAGKVVQKSGLRTYETKKKEKKFFFLLGVADETDSIKVMVYGKERFREFVEGRSYTFRNDLELEAQMLVCKQSPLFSIEQIRTSEETFVSVKGTVTEINRCCQVKVKNKRRKIKVLKFELKDETGRIEVTLWGEDTAQLRGTSVGDFVRVINVKTRSYNNTMSLNSTDSTRILKVQKAAVQDVTMLVIGIVKAGRTSTELEADISGEVTTFTVSSSLLAKVFGVRLGGDFEDRLLDILPFSAEATIQGNQIQNLEASKEM
ncbi:uncharacterized protein LOC108251084 isoform X2 [Kryptolebias marmoratus]|uniref:uncharacterized protein LOC108251084 isoform X2 n=1 Tax=Kryptolebias marmoratus TaxID=37003 RepID=UPI0018ACAFF8|nr:uncharacterized protein LOC108251084 isoform X2 [Kryptolebias marmoratus]